MDDVREPATNTAPAQPKAFDWLLLAMLVALGSSSFSMIRVAVETIPPAIVSAGRLWVGAALMYAIMRFAGRRFPPFVERHAGRLRLARDWSFMLAVSFIGYAVPFFIFPWAQQYIASGLAGVYMAFMPIWTLGLAYFFAGESLTPGKIAGFAMGFTGVMILLGADIIGGAARSGVLAQAALLLATLCYAASAVISRRAPAIRPRVFAAGTVLGAAIFSTPFLLFAEWRPDDWSLASALSIVGLGAGPTGLAGLIIIIVIKRAGAGFMALANYIVPVTAVFAGAALFGEELRPRVFLALAIILAGVAVSQRRRKTPVAATAGGLAPVTVASVKQKEREAEAV
ncbi:MAG: DMT family transporter [Pseudomonadota bacterium]|nr:DMT family transporter [Pseudomonadota bacterium]